MIASQRFMRDKFFNISNKIYFIIILCKVNKLHIKTYEIVKKQTVKWFSFIFLRRHSYLYRVFYNTHSYSPLTLYLQNHLHMRD